MVTVTNIVVLWTYRKMRECRWSNPNNQHTGYQLKDVREGEGDKKCSEKESVM